MTLKITHEGSTLADRYRLGRLLGRGGMADVYEGHDLRLDRQVAVKVLRAEVASPEVRARFEQEARAAAGIAHPNVVAVYDTGEDPAGVFIVMERLPGRTLADRMADGPLPVEVVRRVAGDVLGALGEAHAAGLVHRDVKPANILLSSDDCAKVADFGIAKSVEVADGDVGTGTNLLLGTPAYLAPERIEGQPATAQSDLFSLGVVLHEALTGTRAFTGPTPVAVADAVLAGELPSVLDAAPEADEALAEAIDRAVRRDPRERFSSAAAMAEAIGVVPAGPGTNGSGGGGRDATAVLPVAGAGLASGITGAMAAVADDARPVPEGAPVAADPTIVTALPPPQQPSIVAKPLGWLRGGPSFGRGLFGRVAAGVVGLALLTLIALAAFGGDDGTASPSVEQTPTTVATTTTPPTTAAPAADRDGDGDGDKDDRERKGGKGKGDD